MSVQLFNTFDVDGQDFQDICCEGCHSNGQNFEFLLLCADCGSFMCDKCMVHHMKNFRKYHPTVSNGKNRGLQTVVATVHTNSETAKSDLVPSAFHKKRQEVKQEIELLEKLLDQKQKHGTGLLSSILQLRNKTFERIAEFREHVTKELDDMEKEIEDLVDKHIMKQSNTLQDDIAKTCQTVTKVKELVDEMESDSSENTEAVNSESSKMEYLQKLLQYVKNVQGTNTVGADTSLKYNMEVMVRKPLEDFCYKVNKMQHLFASETDLRESKVEIDA